jgi:hypothetical protein
VIIDIVGAPYFERNLKSLAMDGRLVEVAIQHGATAEKIDLFLVMRKRLTITGSTMRPRTTVEKGEIAAALRAKVWPALDAGRAGPVIHAVFPMSEAAAAHRPMEGSTHVGKIIPTSRARRHRIPPDSSGHDSRHRVAAMPRDLRCHRAEQHGRNHGPCPAITPSAPGCSAPCRARRRAARADRRRRGSRRSAPQSWQIATVARAEDREHLAGRLHDRVRAVRPARDAGAHRRILRKPAADHREQAFEMIDGRRDVAGRGGVRRSHGAHGVCRRRPCAAGCRSTT